MKRFISLALVPVMLFLFTSCSDEYAVKENADFKAWFNQALVPEYDAYKSGEQAPTVAPASIALLLSTELYIQSVFDYICDGVYPAEGEITEENGVYTYSATLFRQQFEFDAKNCAIKVTTLMDMLGENTTEFVVVLAEKKDEFFIQYFSPVYGEYYEIRFAEGEGSFAQKSDCYEAPYDIFSDDIPKDFAKES